MSPQQTRLPPSDRFFLLKFPFKISEFPFFPISDILLKSKLDTEGYKMVPFFSTVRKQKVKISHIFSSVFGKCWNKSSLGSI